MFSLVLGTDPVLYRPARPVRPDEIAELTSMKFRWNLHKFMLKNRGVGLAAPQLGDGRTWFYWNRGLVINPQLLSHSDTFELGSEGCLSFPGRRADIRRATTIEIAFIDETGPRRQTYADFNARVIQHEMDHLRGVCIFRSPEAQLPTP